MSGQSSALTPGYLLNDFFCWHLSAFIPATRVKISYLENFQKIFWMNIEIWIFIQKTFEILTLVASIEAERGHQKSHLAGH